MKFRELLEQSVNEAKFIYSDAADKLKEEGFWDSFQKLKKGLKKTHTVVMELDAQDKITSLEIMSKSEYKDMAQDKNWEDAMVRIYESTDLNEGLTIKADYIRKSDSTIVTLLDFNSKKVVVDKAGKKKEMKMSIFKAQYVLK